MHPSSHGPQIASRASMSSRHDHVNTLLTLADHAKVHLVFLHYLPLSLSFDLFFAGGSICKASAKRLKKLNSPITVVSSTISPSSKCACNSSHRSSLTSCALVVTISA